MKLPNNTVAILNDGNTVITLDDHCYCIQNWNGERWGYSAWIFQEALEVLKTLPGNPNMAKPINMLKIVK